MMREFLCSDRYDDAEWCFIVRAEDWPDARRRLRAIGDNGTVDGTDPVELAGPGAGIATRLLTRLFNLFAPGNRSE